MASFPPDAYSRLVSITENIAYLTNGREIIDLVDYGKHNELVSRLGRVRVLLEQLQEHVKQCCPSAVFFIQRGENPFADSLKLSTMTQQLLEPDRHPTYETIIGELLLIREAAFFHLRQASQPGQ